MAKKVFTISAKIKCGDGGELVRGRQEEKNVGKPDATLTETKSGALKAFAAAIGAFLGAFMKEIKEKAEEENRGEITEVEFTLSDGKDNVKKKTLNKEDIEKIVKG